MVTNFGFLMRKGYKPYGLPNAVDDYVKYANHHASHKWLLYDSLIRVTPSGNGFRGYVNTEQMFKCMRMFNTMARELPSGCSLRLYMHKHASHCHEFVTKYVKSIERDSK